MQISIIEYYTDNSTIIYYRNSQLKLVFNLFANFLAGLVLEMRKVKMDKITNALKHFKLCGEVKEFIPYGNGHINDTFLIVCIDKNNNDRDRKYILQSVNKQVFKEPKKVMENIEKVTSYLLPLANEAREVLTYIPTIDDKSYYEDENGCFWRMYDFINDSICIDRIESDEDFYQSAVAFGNFQRLLTNFPAETLHEIIPNFHNTPIRYNDFLKAVENDSFGRAANVKDEIDFIKERADFYSILLDNNKQGKLPLRVSHNDTKSNNVMLDINTRKPLCVIDLDTIMPGFSVTDFGDSIRFGASTAAEDEKDLSKVTLNVHLFEVYTKGFLKGCGGQLLDSEIMLLPEGSKMMTIECGIRFLTDYLSGDTYFKTSYPEHNLDRCRTQLKLVSEMEKNWDTLKGIVKQYCKA